MYALLFLSIFTFLFVVLVPATKADLNTTTAFIVKSRNQTYPEVDGKDLWIHYNGGVFLDAGVANPRLSYQLIAFLEQSRLRRIRQTASSGPGSSPGTEGNLNFGTSNVCCDYARLNYSAPDSIPYPARTKPFLLVGRHNEFLVFGEDPVFERRPWYACTLSPGSSWRALYYNKPFYDFPDHGDSECIVVALEAQYVSTLPPHAPTPTPPPTLNP